MTNFNRVCIRGHSQVRVALADGSTPAASGPLQPGTYDVWSDVDMHIKTGTPAQAVAVSATTGYFIAAGNVVSVAVEVVGDAIGALGAATGTLIFHKVG